MATTTTATMLLLSLLFLLHSPSLSERCHPEDKKALLQLKKDLNNPYILASWDPKDDCCEWYVSKCDEKTNRIISLDISSSVPDTNFSAQIPPSIGNLPYLQSLTFHKLPKLTGPLPPAITKLTNLNFLRIDFTNLSGPIPPFLSKLTKLTYINLSYNNLTGPIPGSLSTLPKLEALFLSRNHLTGPIPPSFAYFKSNPDIDLSRNTLSGPIPSLKNLNFRKIDLSRNNLVGDATSIFGAHKTGLQEVYLDKNKLSFDLTKVEIPVNVFQLDVSHNKLYGNLPQGVTKLGNLQLLNVSYNMLCGQIPVGGNLKRFSIYEFFHNKCLCGSPLPPCRH